MNSQFKSIFISYYMNKKFFNINKYEVIFLIVIFKQIVKLNIKYKIFLFNMNNKYIYITFIFKDEFV